MLPTANPYPHDSYAKVTEIAAALNRHERTIRLLHEEFGYPDFLEKLKGRPLNPHQQIYRDFSAKETSREV